MATAREAIPEIFEREESSRRSRPVVFVAWGAAAGRSAEIVAALGGESRCFFPMGAPRRPPVLVRYLLSAVATAAYLWRRRPRVVIVTSPPVPAAWFTAICAKVQRAAVILDSHPGSFGAQGDRVSARLQPVHRRLVRRAAAVIVTDEAWVERVHSWGGRAVVVHEAPGDVVAGQPARGERLRLLVVGNFNPDEPVSEVLEAAQHLPGCDFLVTGDLSKCDRALQAAAPPNVHMVGFLDPPRYRAALESCDAVVTLTTEPTSVMRAAYEAVYARRPVVVSDWPVARRLFPHAIHTSNDAAGLVAAIEGLGSDYGHFAALVDLARADQRARWQGQLQALLDVVDPLLCAVRDREGRPDVERRGPRRARRRRDAAPHRRRRRAPAAAVRSAVATRGPGRGPGDAGWDVLPDDQRPFRTVRSKIPKLARKADSGTTGKRSFISPVTLDQS